MDTVKREWMEEELGFWCDESFLNAEFGFRRESITLEKELDYFLADWIAAYGTVGVITTFEEVVAQLRKSINAQAYHHEPNDPPTPKKRFRAEITLPISAE